MKQPCLTDGVILVSRVHRCDRNVLSHVIENVRFAKIPVLGLVANGVVPDGKGYQYYSYGGYGTPQEEPDQAHVNGNGGIKPSAAKDGLKLTDFLKSRK